MNGSAWHRATALVAGALMTVSSVVIGAGSHSTAVVGGAPTTIEQVPWQALVIVEPENRLCGGSLIDPGWIVTAAHCVAGFTGSQVAAHLGITSLAERASSNRIEISEIIVHPSWEPTNFRNDIALLRLAAPVTSSPRAAPISLPVGLDGASWPAEGTPAGISGWGAVEFGGQPSTQLRQAQVQVLADPADAECGRYGGNFDASVEICAGASGGGVDSCQGDSGSPLVVDVAGTRMLAGLTSVGFECARADYPGIYTRVTTFITWLQQYLPASASSPSMPQNVTVQALAGERLQVEWQPPTVGLQPVGYRAVAQPGGRECQVDATQRSCVIDGLTAGTLYEVVLSATLPVGAEVVAEPVLAVGVDGVTSPGVVVKSKRLAQWAGLRARARDEIRLTVRPEARERCARVGDALSPRGVRIKQPGLCAVRVTVTRPGGKTDRAIAYIDVR